MQIIRGQKGDLIRSYLVHEERAGEASSTRQAAGRGQRAVVAHDNHLQTNGDNRNGK